MRRRLASALKRISDVLVYAAWVLIFADLYALTVVHWPFWNAATKAALTVLLAGGVITIAEWVAEPGDNTNPQEEPS